MAGTIELPTHVKKFHHNQSFALYAIAGFFPP